MQKPSQETSQADSPSYSVTSPSSCISRTSSKESTLTCPTNESLQNPTMVDGRVVSPHTPITPPTTISDAAFKRFPSVPGHRDMSDVTTTFTDTAVSVNSSMDSPYLSPSFEQSDIWSESVIMMSECCQWWVGCYLEFASLWNAKNEVEELNQFICLSFL